MKVEFCVYLKWFTYEIIKKKMFIWILKKHIVDPMLSYHVYIYCLVYHIISIIMSNIAFISNVNVSHIELTGDEVCFFMTLRFLDISFFEYISRKQAALRNRKLIYRSKISTIYLFSLFKHKTCLLTEITKDWMERRKFLFFLFLSWTRFLKYFSKTLCFFLK